MKNSKLTKNSPAPQSKPPIVPSNQSRTIVTTNKLGEKRPRIESNLTKNPDVNGSSIKKSKPITKTFLSKSHDNLASGTVARRRANSIITTPRPRSTVGVPKLSKDEAKTTVNKENLIIKERLGKRPSRISMSNIFQRTSSIGNISGKEHRIGKRASVPEIKMSPKSPISMAELEKEKKVLEIQISELVKKAEQKTAEMATLKMEINQLKTQRPSEELFKENDRLKHENQLLKERLAELGVSVEQSTLSDSEKQRLLKKGNSPEICETSPGNIDQRASPGPSHPQLSSTLKNDIPSKAPSSTDTLDESASDIGEATGGIFTTPDRPLSDWDKQSSSSLSELSVACLQDRIQQMEEHHYSTSEELQATLQELTDLQDAVSELTNENDRLNEEKSVLMESLCNQTEKLEQCRTQIENLKALLLRPTDDVEMVTGTPGKTDREQRLVELIKSAHEERAELLTKQDEHHVLLHEAQQSVKENGHQVETLRDKIRFLEGGIESANADKRLLEKQLSESRETISNDQIEITRLKTLLDNAKAKVEELQQYQQKMGDKTELDELLEVARKEKDKSEAIMATLQESLSLSQCEVLKLRENLSIEEEEHKVTKNNAKKQISDLEYKIERQQAEKEVLHREIEDLRDMVLELEKKCQRHLEDKRELKANISDLKKTSEHSTEHKKKLEREVHELRKQIELDTSEWKHFEKDLLVTVKVANDFKTEVQQDMEKLAQENQSLLGKVEYLSSELEKAKAKKIIPSPKQLSRTMSNPFPTIPSLDSKGKVLLKSVERELDVLRGQRQRLGSTPAGGNQLSVKTLIETLENVAKQSQPGNVSRSSSVSSTSSVTDSKPPAGLMRRIGDPDVFIKPSLRPLSVDSSNSILKEHTTNNTIQPLKPQRNSYTEGIHDKTSASENIAPSGGLKDKDPASKPVPVPVSILANKSQNLRRNSYSLLSFYSDVVEKKDPLSTLVKAGGSKRNALLKWCQTKTLGYKGIDITNFSSSWNDGLAFCAVIHSYLHDKIPYDTLDAKDKRRNFTLAFQAAESVGIPTTLNINDMVSIERPDWQSVMTYITSIYKHFET